MTRPASSIRRASRQADAIGSEVLLARTELGMTRTRVGARAGVARDTVRRIEAGDPAVQLDTLCAVAGAVGVDVVLRAYRAGQPSLRDAGQLELARILIGLAHPTWQADLEVPAGEHGEAVDVVLFGATEIIGIEIDTLVLDFQAQHRRNVLKREYLSARHQRPVRLVWAVADTARNRRSMAPHVGVVGSQLPSRSRDVLASVRSGRPLGRDGLLWLRRRQPPPPRRSIGGI